jgi:activator of HSP90 ATPase
MGDKASPAAVTERPSRRRAIFGVVGAFGGLVLSSTRVWAAAEDGISHTAESIHQEPVFTASPKRVYEALTDAKEFTRIIRLSGALQAMHLPDTPAEISREAGGAFALYGGYITGRHVELVPNVRIVQAWRAGRWPPGVYSIAKFELAKQGAGCKIVFDHTGFPKGDAESLASGWRAHYWEPLAKVLAKER